MKIPPRTLWLLALPFLGACQPSIKLDTKELLSVNDPVAKPQAPAPKAVKAPSSDPVLVAEGDEPNWDDRRAELLAEGQEKFKAPGPDDLIPIEIKGGDQVRQGMIRGIDPDKVTFQIEGEDGSILEPTLPRSALAPQTLRLAYPDEAAEAYADLKLDEEKKAWDAEQEDIFASAAPASNGPPPAGIPGMGAPDTMLPGTTVKAMPPPKRLNGPIVLETRRTSGAKQLPDGSMPQVTLWLKKNIANPNSIKVESWGKLVPELRGKGKQIDVRFSSDAGSFGRYTETKRFFINDRGSIYEVANVK